MTDGLNIQTMTQELYAANGGRRSVNRRTLPQSMQEKSHFRGFRTDTRNNVWHVLLANFRCGISFATGKLFIGRNQIAMTRKDGVGWCRRVQ